MEMRRLNLALDDITNTRLKDLRYATDLSYTAIVKRALKMLDFMIDAEAKGFSLQVVDKNGRVVQNFTAFLPPQQ